MEYTVGAIGVLIVFGAIIAVHEFGHFIFAKWSKMGVHEFSLGFGPALWQREYRGTLYALRCIPLGGYVRIVGMEPGEDAFQADGFETKPFYAKFATLLAGVFMNFVLALIVMIIMGLSVGFPTTRVGGVQEKSPAAQMGLQPGDVLVQVGKTRNPSPEETEITIQKTTPPLALVIERQGKRLPLRITPVMFPGEHILRIGIQLEPSFQKAPPVEAISRGMISVYQNTSEMLYGLWMLITGHISLRSGAVMGPPEIIHLIDTVAQKALRSKENMARFLLLFALISLNVGIINLLPFPALDGSRLLFLLIEKIIRRPFNKEVEAVVHMVGLALLLGFIGFISVREILHMILPLKGHH